MGSCAWEVITLIWTILALLCIVLGFVGELVDERILMGYRSFAAREESPERRPDDRQVAIAVGSALSVVRPQGPPPIGICPGRAR
jgi:hypothetical protein